MKHIYFIILAVLFQTSLSAQTRTTIQNGNATNPFTWDCTCVPLPGNAIVINHALTLDTDFAYTSGSILVNASGSVTGNIPTRILGVGGGSFTNYGTVDVANMYHQAGTFTNHNIMIVDNAFGITLTATTVNNGNMTITDSLYINTNAQITNNGTVNATVTLNAGHLHNEGTFVGTDIWTSGMLMHVTGSFDITNLYNSGSVTTSSAMTINSDFWNSENVDINHDLTIGNSLYNGDTTGGPATFTNDGIISIVADFANSKTVTGAGDFCIGQSTTNSGTISGTLDICDQTGGSIDFNTGTIAGTVTYCTTGCNVGIEEDDFEKITVYPNPFENQFEIRTQKIGSYRVQLVNAIGQILMDQHYNAQVVKLDASHLPGGIYFYRLSLGNALVSTGKLIKR